MLDSDVADCRPTRPGGAGRDHGRAVPARVRRRRAVGPPRHRRSPGDAPTGTGSRSTAGPTGFGARLLLRLAGGPWPHRRVARPVAAGLRLSVLTADQQAVADRQQAGTSASSLATALPSSRIATVVGVALGRVGHPVVPQRVVEGHHAAGPQQPQRLGRGSRRTPACRRRRTPGRSAPSVSRGSTSSAGAGDQPGALGGDAGLGEGLPGQPLVLGLDVDGGQDAVGAHAAQQPEPGDAGAGADLDDRHARRATAASKRSAAPPPAPIGVHADLLGTAPGPRRGSRPRRRTPRRRSSSRASVRVAMTFS